MIAENGNPVRLFDFLQNYELTEENLPLAFEQVAKYMGSELSRPLEDFGRNLQKGMKRREAYALLADSLKAQYMDDFAIGLEAVERRGGDINSFVSKYGKDIRRSMKNRRKSRLLIIDAAKEMLGVIFLLIISGIVLSLAARFPVEYVVLDTAIGRMLSFIILGLIILYCVKLIRFERNGGGA
ncbi:MAG: type II secretion system F family protein [Lachnospiraceae bacterium]|nr:type II secretion system F family protein [Lachnospiraceae bacterium]